MNGETIFLTCLVYVVGITFAVGGVGAYKEVTRKQMSNEDHAMWAAFWPVALSVLAMSLFARLTGKMYNVLKAATLATFKFKPRAKALKGYSDDELSEHITALAKEMAEDIVDKPSYFVANDVMFISYKGMDYVSDVKMMNWDYLRSVHGDRSSFVYGRLHESEPQRDKTYQINGKGQMPEKDWIDFIAYWKQNEKQKSDKVEANKLLTKLRTAVMTPEPVEVEVEAVKAQGTTYA